jgi:hypothetical protein
VADRSPKRIDVTVPAVRDAVQRLLDRADVAEVHLCKSLKPEDPVSVGLRRLPELRMSWWYGPTAFQVVSQVEESLKPRTLVGEDARG